MFSIYEVPHYTLGASGIKFSEKVFNTRSDAKEYMFKYMDKKGINVITQYKDNHYRTYKCNDGINFYINRI